MTTLLLPTFPLENSTITSGRSMVFSPLALLGCFLVILVVQLALTLRKSRSHQTLSRIPSPKTSLPIFGDALTFLFSTSSPSVLLAQFARSLGPLCQISIFGEPLVLVCDRVGIERVLADKEWKASFDRGSFFMGVFRGVLGQGSMLCQNSDSTFTAHKKMLVPSFTASSLDKHAMPIMHTSIDRLFKLWSSIPDAEAGNDKGGPLMDAERSISLLTKEIMLRFIFGADLGVLEKSDGNAQQAHQVVSWIEVVFDTLNPIPIITPFKRTFNIRYHYARFRLFRWMGQQIDQCMAEDESVPMVVDGMAAPWSVMKECLRRNQTNGLSTNEVRDELFTLLLAGDDTVASQLCWILNHLIFNPDTQRRIREELEMLPSQPELSYAEIMGLSRSLPVLSSFVSESLRLAGTIPLTSREAIRDTFLLSTTDSAEAIQYPIKKGTSIVLLLDATGKGAEVEAGKTFNLDRWLDPESGEYDASRVGSHPFSLGTRACFGIRFAQLFLRLFVARLVQEYDLFSPSMAEKSEQQQRGKEIQVREVISRRPLETKVRLRQMRDT